MVVNGDALDSEVGRGLPDGEEVPEARSLGEIGEGDPEGVGIWLGWIFTRRLKGGLDLNAVSGAGLVGKSHLELSRLEEDRSGSAYLANLPVEGHEAVGKSLSERGSGDGEEEKEDSSGGVHGGERNGGSRVHGGPGYWPWWE